jgi:hypothetical protein
MDGVVSSRLALVDAVDHLLNKGVVLTGETMISLAGVDLVYLGLNVLLSSVETLRKDEGPPGPTHPSSFIPHLSGGAGERAGAALPPSDPRLYAEPRTHGAESSPPEPAPAVVSLTGLPERLAADADDRPERGLARLVLTLIELLRQIVERQALRRVEGEALADDQVERMGVALMELEAKMAELRDAFGLSEEDLALDLGPLGRLL